jgi:hypothetical protein
MDCYAGIDWATEEHALCVVDEAGAALAGELYPHTEAGICELIARMRALGVCRRYESAAVISNDGDLKLPIQIVREELGLPVTVANPVLHSKHRSAALSPDPLPPNARFIRLSAHDVEECQFPEQVISPKGAKLVKPAGW